MVRYALLVSGTPLDEGLVMKYLIDGVELLVAETTDEAVKLMNHIDPVVMVVNCTTPGTRNAMSLVRAVSSDYPEIPIVGITNGSDSEDDMMEAGCTSLAQACNGSNIGKAFAAAA